MLLRQMMANEEMDDQRSLSSKRCVSILAQLAVKSGEKPRE